MSKKYGGWCENEKVLSNGYCHFHAPKGEKSLSVEEFNNLIFGRLRTALETNKALNLSGTIFEDYIDFSRINKEMKLPGVDFSRAVFEKADFTWVTFVGDAEFFKATFKGNSYFEMTVFEKKASFWMTIFMGNADFRGSGFVGKASFLDAHFKGEVRFGGSGAKVKDRPFGFHNKADFIGVVFDKKADFESIEFKSEATFVRATFNEEALFYGPTFFNKDIDRPVRVLFNNAIIKNRVVFQNVNLEHATFLETDLRRMDFVNTIPNENDGRYILQDENEVLGRKNPDRNEIRKVESLYRAQKQKCAESYNMHDYSLWHISEKEMMRRQSGGFYRVLLELYRLFSSYGEAPGRAFLVVLVVFIFALGGLGKSGFRYENNQQEDGKEIHFLQKDRKEIHLMTFSKPYYDFSDVGKVALTTLEYLTFQRERHFGLKPANGLTALLRIIFTILFYGQTALFLFALRNRFRR